MPKLQEKKTKRSPSVRAKATRAADADESVVAGVQLSNPRKLLYPDDGITKLDLAHYYAQVAEWMLPHVANRLLSLVRCPAGSGKPCFFQKHPASAGSKALHYFDVEEKNETDKYIAVKNLAGLVSLVQLGVLEIHVWGSLANRYDKPDRLVFDLDPDPAVDWTQVISAAKEVRALLEELELVSFVKTTGGKGLHVLVPIQRRLSWGDAKVFCRALADYMVASDPSRYIAKMSKAARQGKIFIDYLRNDQGATSIAAYSTRNRPGAPVSVPLRWDELSPRLKSDHFNIRNLPARLAKLDKDPWAEMKRIKQSISVSMLKKLKKGEWVSK